MKNNARGFFLVTLSILLAILSLLVTNFMQQLWLHEKLKNTMITQHKVFALLETTAKSLINTNAPNCILNYTDANIVLEKLKAGFGCSVSQDNYNFKYYAQNLGDFPCVLIKHNNAYIGTSQTLFTITSLDNNAFLQLRIAKPAKQKISCINNNFKIIQTNYLSSRYFSISN